MSKWPWLRHAEQREMDGCPVVDQQLLQSYLDGETDLVTTHRVWAHVEECHRCSADLSSYWKIKNALARCEPLDEAAVERMRDFAESLLASGKDASEEAVPEAGA